MELKDILELSVVTLGSLGSGAAIVFGFSSWLGKVWANRLMIQEKAEYAQELESLRSRLTQDTESYKIKLKKSEFIFQKEYEAASELVALRMRLLPEYRHPDMDWSEVCDEIAHGFSKIEKTLGDYLSKHGAVLNQIVKNLLIHAINIAGEHKFEVTSTDMSLDANKAADELYNELTEAEKCLLEQVHSQSST